MNASDIHMGADQTDAPAEVEPASAGLVTLGILLLSVCAGVSGHPFIAAWFGATLLGWICFIGALGPSERP
jgi:hypothetical protein